MLLPVALGDTMSVNTILGNNIVTEWRLALSFDPPLIISTVLRENFDVIYEPTRRTVYAKVDNMLDPNSGSNEEIAQLHKLSNGTDDSTTHPTIAKSWG